MPYGNCVYPHGMSTTVRESANDYVAQEIRAELGRQRLSARELARRMEVDQPWLQKRLAGVIPLRVGEVFEIADCLHLPIERLFDAAKQAGKAAGRMGLEFGVSSIRLLMTRILPVHPFSIRAA